MKFCSFLSLPNGDLEIEHSLFIKSILILFSLLIKLLFFSEASPSKIANALSVINGLEPLNGSNYPSWREKLMMALTMADIDYAIENPRPVEPVMAADDTPDAANNPARQMSYDLAKAK